MSRYSDDSSSTERGKALVLELLTDSPGNQVTRWPQASFHLLINTLLSNLAFEANLDSAKDIWQLALTLHLVSQLAC